MSTSWSPAAGTTYLTESGPTPAAEAVGDRGQAARRLARDRHQVRLPHARGLCHGRPRGADALVAHQLLRDARRQRRAAAHRRHVLRDGQGARRVLAARSPGPRRRDAVGEHDRGRPGRARALRRPLRRTQRPGRPRCSGARPRPARPPTSSPACRSWTAPGRSPTARGSATPTRNGPASSARATCPRRSAATGWSTPTTATGCRTRSSRSRGTPGSSAASGASGRCAPGWSTATSSTGSPAPTGSPRTARSPSAR